MRIGSKTSLLFLACCLVSALASAQSQPSEWDRIYRVLTSPRCLNCHTSTDYPRQGDDRHVHKFGVLRGQDGNGVPGAMCAACHGAINNAAAGIPGGKGWHLAPLSMSWEQRPGVAMTSAQLCFMLKDPARNGKRDLNALLEHNSHEPLVNWAWQPGAHPNGEPRQPPPMPHDAFVEVFRQWVAKDGPCPAQ
ncbi:hypothetical protein [Pandoraea terrae]|nr:hypothetical protein [Pandoraea terrae]